MANNNDNEEGENDGSFKRNFKSRDFARNNRSFSDRIDETEENDSTAIFKRSLNSNGGRDNFHRSSRYSNKGYNSRNSFENNKEDF